MESEKVIIFDTTLRDGEQAPGCSMGPAAKLQVAEQLYRLGVDVIEAGFSRSSQRGLEAGQNIPQMVCPAVGAPEVWRAGRCGKRVVEGCREAVKPAKRPRIPF